MRVHAVQVINGRPEEVFRFVATDHFENHAKWDPAVEVMTPTSPGPMREGATARLIRRDQGKAVEGTVTVTTYQPVHAFAAVSRFGPFTLHQEVGIEAVGDGRTLVHLAIDTAATGTSRLLLPLMRRRFRRTMTTSLRAMKQHIEADAR